MHCDTSSAKLWCIAVVPPLPDPLPPLCEARVCRAGGEGGAQRRVRGVSCGTHQRTVEPVLLLPVGREVQRRCGRPRGNRDVAPGAEGVHPARLEPHAGPQDHVRDGPRVPHAHVVQAGRQRRERAPDLYATMPPIAVSAPVTVCFAYSVIGAALEIACTKRTYDCDQLIPLGSASSTTNASAVLVAVS
jgi:hypothetical protein